MSLYVINFNELRYIDKKNNIIINTTSTSKNWSKGLSPFLVPAGKLYGNYFSYNIENMWQMSKVYKCHIDKNGDPTSKYFEWAKKGWLTKKGIRYPMGKGAKPEYSYWDGEKLSYVEARKKIYLPYYAKNVIKTKSFKLLKELYLNETKKDIYLLDFDGYNHVELGLSDDYVLNTPYRSMGHGFVIYFLLKRFHKNE